MIEHRWSGPSGRIEALTDTVFGFSITLLVVSLEVPDTFDDLVASMQGFAAFGLSFVLLILVWYYHYQLFRRYPLSGGRAVVLNSLLLFVVLFYVYPLKFVANLMVSLAMGRLPIDPADMSLLMAIYSSGFVLVFLVFALLYDAAIREQASLELAPVEVLDARGSLYDCLVMVGVGILSVILALLVPPPWTGPVAGTIYFLIWPLQAIVSRWHERRRALLLTHAAPPSDPAS